MNIIEAYQLSKYYGKDLGIKEVTLQVKEGDIFGFIGPNGAGKSTTIRLMLNLIFPSGGILKVLGLDAVKDSKKIKYQVGYLPGEVEYYDDLTVKELLRYSARFYDADLSKMNALVKTFDLDVNKKIYSLSLGNKKKVGIIQALLHRPKLLILDEPTNGLDPLMQKRFFEVLSEENRQGTTIFFSSHILSEVQKICNRIGIIKDGEIIRVVETARLRQEEFRKVRIEVSTGFLPDLSLLPGAIKIAVQEQSIEMLFNGDINELLRVLSSGGITNLWIEEPALDEVFMHYYEGGQE